MKNLNKSDATELKNGENTDQGPVILKNTTNIDLDIDININIDIDSQSENDFYEAFLEENNCLDDQYEEQCKFDYECECEAKCQCISTPYNNQNGIYRKYDDYSSLVHGLYEHMAVDCTAIRMSWNNLLIYKSNNEFFYYYSVYDTSKRGDRGQYLEIGDCMDPDDVSKIISYYLETGKCFGHK
jgi:hypothetical protein